MTNKQELVKVTIFTEVEPDGVLKYKDRLTDITFDLDNVVAFSHYLNLQNGALRTDITEVVLNTGYMFLVKINYNDFKLLIS